MAAYSALRWIFEGINNHFCSHWVSTISFPISGLSKCLGTSFFYRTLHLQSDPGSCPHTYIDEHEHTNKIYMNHLPRLSGERYHSYTLSVPGQCLPLSKDSLMEVCLALAAPLFSSDCLFITLSHSVVAKSSVYGSCQQCSQRLAHLQNSSLDMTITSGWSNSHQLGFISILYFLFLFILLFI